MKLPDPTTFLGDPWTPRFLLWLIPATALTSAIVVLRQYDANILAAIPVVAASIIFALATERTISKVDTSGPHFGLIAAALIISIMGLVLFGRDAGLLGWIATILPFVLLLLISKSSERVRSLILYPLMWCCLPLAVASMMNVPRGGGFPAAIAFLFSLVMNMTRKIEEQTAAPQSVDEHPAIHLVHRLPLARISMIFFVFGVVALWPWLGKVYNHLYFWILVAGVLLPTTLYWGRLRQPRDESSYEALVRFNRLSPYLAGVLLLAIAVA